MQPGTSHSGLRSPGHRTTLPPFPWFQSALPPSTMADVHLRPSLDFQLSTVNSDPCAQPPYFDNLPHSSTTWQISPLCFHTHTNTFSRIPFLLKSLRFYRGCTPQFANSCTINNFFDCLFTMSSQGHTLSLGNPKKVEPFSPPDGILYRVQDSADELRPELRKTKVPGEGSFRDRKK